MIQRSARFARILPQAWTVAVAVIARLIPCLALCLALLACLSGAASCVAKGATFLPSDTPRATIFISPTFCAGAASCVLGRVTRASRGDPVGGASIFIAPLTSGSSDQGASSAHLTAAHQAQVARSDLDGFFAFANLPPNLYALEVYGLGESDLGTYTGEVRVSGAGVVFVDVRLGSDRR